MIRVATIGTSMITTQFAAAVRKTPGIVIGCVYSRDLDKATRVARELGAAQASDSFSEVLESDAVDAVYVASPNSLHFEHAIAALRAGKHVLVEKPAVPTEAEFVALAEAARASGVVLLEEMRTAYDPGLDVVRAALGSLGTLRRASLRYCQRSARYDQVLAGNHVNIFDPAMAGGALLDLGVYPIAVLVALFGEPVRVLSSSIMIASGADGAGVALAVYPELVADVSWSKITASTLPSEIQGERGTLTIDHMASPGHMRIDYADGTHVDHDLSSGDPNPLDNMRFGVQRFVDLIEGRGDSADDHRRTKLTLRIVDAVRRQAQ